MTQALGAERGTPDWRWPPTSGSGPLALATPCAQVPGRYAGPSNFKSRVAHPWSWDIGQSTSAAQTSLNMVHSRQKARPFGLSTKLGLQDNGRPSPKEMALANVFSARDPLDRWLVVATSRIAAWFIPGSHIVVAGVGGRWASRQEAIHDSCDAQRARIEPGPKLPESGSIFLKILNPMSSFIIHYG